LSVWVSLLTLDRLPVRLYRREQSPEIELEPIGS